MPRVINTAAAPSRTAQGRAMPARPSPRMRARNPSYAQPLMVNRPSVFMNSGMMKRRYAEGYEESVTPQSIPVRVPAHLWRVLVLDETGVAEGGGLRYVGLRIFKRRPDVSLKGEARRWLSGVMSKPKTTDKDGLKTLARLDHGMKPADFNRLWKEILAGPHHSDWDKPGTISKKRQSSDGSSEL